MAGAAAAVERTWRQRIEDSLEGDVLDPLSVRSARDTAIFLGVIWVQIAGLLLAATYVVHLPIGWAVPLGALTVILMATRINALNVAVHEGSHGFLARSRRLNDLWCNAAAAWWTLSSVEEYRPTHRLHHRNLGELNDPDRPSYFLPERPWALPGLLLQDLVGITALRRAKLLLSTSQSSGSAQRSVLFTQLGKAVTQLILVCCLVVSQGVAIGLGIYVVVWVFPLLCLFPMILRLKTIAEHFDPSLREPSHLPWVVRTSAAGRMQNYLIGARMEYHFEHHVYPTIPFRGLRKLHRQLAASQFFDANPEVLSHGYVQFVTRLPRPVGQAA